LFLAAIAGFTDRVQENLVACSYQQGTKQNIPNTDWLGYHRPGDCYTVAQVKLSPPLPSRLLLRGWV